MRITEAQYKQLLGRSLNHKQNKYHNKKVECNGIKFDSKKEAQVYSRLQTAERFKIIKDLERQVKYELIPKFKLNNKTYRSISYIADFRYITTKDNKTHVVDVKSPITAKNEVYKLKKKLMAYKYGIEIEEE